MNCYAPDLKLIRLNPDGTRAELSHAETQAPLASGGGVHSEFRPDRVARPGTQEEELNFKEFEAVFNGNRTG
jgi:hypothetical protein